MKIYYAKSVMNTPHWMMLTDAREMKFVSMSKSSFRRNYKKLPITLLTNDPNRAFDILNNEDNPMSTDVKQNWLRANGVRHTSMSVGDVMLVNGKYFIVMGVGFAEIQWVS